MTSQARPAAICSWLSVHVLCIESAVVQSRSCRLVAGMHSTSFVLGKEVGCLRSVFCALVSNIDRLLAREWCFFVGCIRSQQQTPYRRLHCQSYASSMVAPDEAAEAAGKIAKSSGDSAAVPRTKGKEFFSHNDTMAVAFVRISQRQ